MLIFDFLIFIFAGLVGYFVGYFSSGKKSGEKGLIMVYINMGKYIFHLHHWFLSSVILIILILVDFYSLPIYGFLAGNLLHGLRYKDFYTLIHTDGILKK